MSKLDVLKTKKLKPRGQMSIGVILYIGFAIFTLINTSWTNTISHELYLDFSYNDMNNKEQYVGPGMYLEQLGRPREGQNLILFWEGSENQARYFDIYSNNSYTTDNLSLYVASYLEDMETFATYGKSCMGAYNLEPSGADNQPQIKWNKTFTTSDLKYVKTIPSIDGDEIPEVFISYGEIQNQLPDLNNYDNYSAYFIDNPTQFNTYFNSHVLSHDENGTINTVIISPKYSSYTNTILHGINGTRARNPVTKTQYSFGNQSINDAVLMNPTLDVNDKNWTFTDSAPELVLLESDLDRAVFRNDNLYYGYQHNLNFNWTDTIKAYQLRNGSLSWTLNQSQMNDYGINYKKDVDYKSSIEQHIQLNETLLPIGDGFYNYDVYENREIKEQVTVPLGSNGFRKLTSVGNGFAIEFYPINYFEQRLTNSFVFDNEGTFLWGGKRPLIVSTKDFNGDGLFTIGELRIKSTFNTKTMIINNQSHNIQDMEYFEYARVALLNSSTGTTIAQYDLDIHNTDSPFRKQTGYGPSTLGKIGIGFTTDDENKDSVPEFIGYTETFLGISTNEDNNDYQIEEGIRGFRLQLSSFVGKLSISSNYTTHYNTKGVQQQNVWSSFDYEMVEEINADVDGDNIPDYIFSLQTEPSHLYLISGGLNALDRNYELDNYMQIADNDLKEGDSSDGGGNRAKKDWRSAKQMIVIGNDFRGSSRVGAVIGTVKGIYYFEDIRLKYTFNNDDSGSSSESESFSDFFPGFSEPLTIGAYITMGIFVIIFLTSFEDKNKLDNESNKTKKKSKKKSKEKDKTKPDPNEQKIELKPTEDNQINLKTPKQKREIVVRLNKLTKISAIILFFSLLAIEMYLLTIVEFTVEYSNNYVGPQASLLWFILIYPAIFPLFTILPFIYTKVAPYFAEKTYINLQKKKFSKKVDQKIIDYKVIVTQMDNRRDVSMTTYITRALLPIMIGLTIGITVYTGMGEDGFITSMIRLTSSNFVAQTNPDNLGIIQENVPFDRIWVEMGKFALYCILPMIITFFATAALIPSSWLLDDAGVSFYIKHRKERGINDVESISSWLLSIIGGFFGMSAIISFVNLFNPFFDQIGALSDAIVVNIANTDNGTVGVIIFVLTLVLFPILMGFSLMVSCIAKIEEEIQELSTQLFERMEKINIDVTPVEIAAFLDSNVGDKPWTEGQEDDITGDEVEKKKLTDEEKKEETERIQNTLVIVPALISTLNISEAINIMRTKVIDAHQNGLTELIEELNGILWKLRNLESFYEAVLENKKIQLKDAKQILELEEDQIKAMIQADGTASAGIEIKRDTLEFKIGIESKEKMDLEVKRILEKEKLDAILPDLYMKFYISMSKTAEKK
jgi:hypothetical protein